MMQSSPFNFRRAVILIGRLFLGGIFLYAAVSKIFLPNKMYSSLPLLKFSIAANLSNFGEQVASFKMLSDAGVAFVSHTLPFAELTLGLLLLIGWRVRIWGAIASLFLLMFLTVVTRAYILHLDINCGCFATPEPVSIKKILEDTAMAGLAILMTYFAFRESREAHPWAAAPAQQQTS
jgi:uncharacterized membrane protein YphA (DoxX/SURF4 family)